jgi:hypothetical protein
MAKRKIKLLDTVALLEDLPKHGLRQGEVGVVVEALGHDAFEIEFVSHSGETYAQLALTTDQLIVLHNQGKSLTLPSAA